MPYIINKKEVQKEFRSFNLPNLNKTIFKRLIIGDTLQISHKFPSNIILKRIDNGLASISCKHFELGLIDTHSKMVIYYVRVITKMDIILNGSYASQILLWRTRRTEYSSILHNLATSIFNDYLLQNYTIMVSDANQSIEGMGFWQARMLEAIDNKYYVYTYDIISGIINEIKTPDDIYLKGEWLWGEESDHQNRVAIISKRQLTL